LVLLCNHQSQLDIPALVSVFSERLLFVAKIELAKIPLLSYWMRQVGCIFIDRSNRAAAHRSLEKAAKEMGVHPLVVFPEGTRSKTGNLLPIKNGGLRMAALAKATILPLHLEGTRLCLENRKAWTQEPIPVQLKVFPAMEPIEGMDEREAVDRMKSYLESCWAKTDSRE
jgi:1-acyl-sn-glycerol-3-phosphate acyltransferase